MLIPFGEWLPDAPRYGNEGCGLARNVTPLSDPKPGYGPARAFVANGAKLEDVPIFLAAVRSPSAVSYQFAASATKIYRSTDSGFTFDDVSRGSGVYSADTEPRWEAAQFGESLVMTNYVDVPQVFDLNTAATFTNLAATAPRARSVIASKNFLIFGNTVDSVDGAVPNRLRWSGLDRIDYFPEIGSNEAIETQSDRQDMLNDFGPIHRLVTPIFGADFAIVQESGISTATYVGAQDGIFTFDDKSTKGALSGGAVCPVGGVIYYWSPEGYMVFDGTQSTPINKVDRWVFDRLDLSQAWRIQGRADPRTKKIRWLMPSKLTGKLDLCLTFNTSTGWWTYQDGYDLSCVGTSVATARLLDDIDEPIDGGIYSELRIDDPIWSGENILNEAVFDASGQFGSLTGLPLEAELETGEYNLSDGQESLVNELWPIVDGALRCQAALGTRKLPEQDVSWTGYSTRNRVGFCSRRGRSRYHSARVKIPAGDDWSFAQGVRMPFIAAGRG